MSETIEQLREKVGFLTERVEELENERETMKRLTSEVIWALVSAVDAKDPYTNGHSGRVADYSWKIAKKMGKDKEFLRDIFYTAVLHDIGKIGIPDSVLNKPAKLSDKEYQLIRNHTNIGSGILEGITTLPEISVGARCHHERYDGKGYPNGLKGEEIPEMARIIAVADTYDAMTSKRVYSDEVISQDEARKEIERCKGSQLDPEIADVMLKLIDEDKEYLMHG